AGVWVFMKRRWVCAASVACISAAGVRFISIHGLIASTGPGGSLVGQSRLATIACVHVVPHLAGVHTKTSPGRGTKPSQRAVSSTAERYWRRGIVALSLAAPCMSMHFVALPWTHLCASGIDLPLSHSTT